MRRIREIGRGRAGRRLAAARRPRGPAAGALARCSPGLPARLAQRQGRGDMVWLLARARRGGRRRLRTRRRHTPPTARSAPRSSRREQCARVSAPILAALEGWAVSTDMQAGYGDASEDASATSLGGAPRPMAVGLVLDLTSAEMRSRRRRSGSSQIVGRGSRERARGVGGRPQRAHRLLIGEESATPQSGSSATSRGASTRPPRRSSSRQRRARRGLVG